MLHNKRNHSNSEIYFRNNDKLIQYLSSDDTIYYFNLILKSKPRQESRVMIKFSSVWPTCEVHIIKKSMLSIYFTEEETHCINQHNNCIIINYVHSTTGSLPKPR